MTNETNTSASRCRCRSHLLILPPFASLPLPERATKSWTNHIYITGRETIHIQTNPDGGAWCPSPTRSAPAARHYSSAGSLTTKSACAFTPFAPLLPLALGAAVTAAC